MTSRIFESFAPEKKASFIRSSASLHHEPNNNPNWKEGTKQTSSRNIEKTKGDDGLTIRHRTDSSCQFIPILDLLRASTSNTIADQTVRSKANLMAKIPCEVTRSGHMMSKSFQNFAASPEFQHALRENRNSKRSSRSRASELGIAIPRPQTSLGFGPRSLSTTADADNSPACASKSTGLLSCGFAAPTLLPFAKNAKSSIMANCPGKRSSMEIKAGGSWDKKVESDKRGITYVHQGTMTDSPSSSDLLNFASDSVALQDLMAADAQCDSQLRLVDLLGKITQLQQNVNALEYEKAKLGENYEKTVCNIVIQTQQELQDLTDQLNMAKENSLNAKKTHDREIKDMKLRMLNKETAYNKSFLEMKRKYGDRIDELAKVILKLEQNCSF